MTSIALFTRDLRVRDLPMLHAACSAPPVVPLFVIDTDIVQRRRSPNRLAFLSEALVDLDASLRALGSGLRVERSDGAPWTDTVVRVAREVGATHVHASRDHSGFARTRFDALHTALIKHDVAFVEHPGVAVVAPGVVTPSSGNHFKVFTPYYRRWLGVDHGRVLARPRSIASLPADAAPELGAWLPTALQLDDDTTSPRRARGGESAALEVFRAWTTRSLAHYDDLHDDLARDGTSRISAALHFGCLSPREVAVRLANRPGAAAFVRQLCWRDFFLQVLAARPDAAGADVRPRTFAPRVCPPDLQRWSEGGTGFPIVDAALRQLRAEGFIHNRARMIAASFLTKDLAIDWRLGAAEFLRWLTDGDIAQNQLNWQWVAGTGTDSNPHRIFNPTRQSQRFDPSGDYIRRHVPALHDVPAPEIHDPTPPTRTRTGYPSAMVDHTAAIAEYRARLNG